MTRPMSEEEREKLEPCPKLREAIENGHLRCSVSVGVGSPVATIDTEDLWRLVHAAERSLSTSASERGLREALETIEGHLAPVPAPDGGMMIMGPDGTYWPFPLNGWSQQRWAAWCQRVRIAALSPKGEDEQ